MPVAMNGVVLRGLFVMMLVLMLRVNINDRARPVGSGDRFLVRLCDEAMTRR